MELFCNQKFQKSRKAKLEKITDNFVEKILHLQDILNKDLNYYVTLNENTINEFFKGIESSMTREQNLLRKELFEKFILEKKDIIVYNLDWDPSISNWTIKSLVV